jgi:hypothetical protein
MLARNLRRLQTVLLHHKAIFRKVTFTQESFLQNFQEVALKSAAEDRN